MLQRSCNADKLGASLIFSYHFLVLFSFLSIAFLIELWKFLHCIDAKGVFSRKNFQSSEDTFCALYAHFFHSMHCLCVTMVSLQSLILLLMVISLAVVMQKISEVIGCIQKSCNFFYI